MFSASALGGSHGPRLSKDELETLVQDAVVWANQHGLVRGIDVLHASFCWGDGGMPAPHAPPVDSQREVT